MAFFLQHLHSDKQIIRLIAKGDKSAFEYFVNQYSPKVLNICLGFLKNYEDAEEVSQDVFVHVFEEANSFREESSVKTWLYRIAINKSLEKLRWKTRKKRFAFFVPIRDDTEKSIEFEHPGIQMERKEAAGILYKSVQKLPEKQRIAFTLFKIQSLSQVEVAELMDLSLSAVESLVFRAKKNLRKDLKNYFSE